METDKYLGLFIDESRENLQKLNESLLLLEQDIENTEILNDIFRVAHTLKGMSRTMGYNDIADLTHEMENVLDPMRSGTIKADSNVIDMLFKCLDKLESLTMLVVEGTYQDKNNDIEDLVKLVKAINTTGNAKEDEKIKVKEIKLSLTEFDISAIESAKEQGFTPIEVEVVLEEACVLPAARAFMAIKIIEAHGEIIKAEPAIEDLESGQFERSFKVIVLTQSDLDEVNGSVKNVSEVEKVNTKVVNSYEHNPSDEETELESAEDKQEQSNEDDDAKTMDNSVNQAKQSVAKLVPQTIRVNADRLDKLMNLVGELVISRTRVDQISSELKSNDLTTAITVIGSVTTDIQEIVMKLRMVSIEQVFNRFPRLVRDLSKTLGKDINLVIKGKETEIDRIVVEEIGDPLVHLLRNSLDHGLETPAERIANGKTAKGTIELSACNEGDNIVIRVSDDGHGIDPEKIKKKALDKGLVTKDVIKNYSEKDILELIFLPGFSTVEVATDLSGRGVGMDVVKSKITNLGGNVSIQSKVGLGTTMTISLPSKMAIVQSLLFKLNEEIYAAPLNYINEIIDVKQDLIKNVQNKEVFVLRGQTIPIIRLGKLLDVPNSDKGEESLTVVITKTQSKTIGLVVSELIGQQEVVIKPINKKLCSKSYISGATTLGNGKIALIINLNALT